MGTLTNRLGSHFTDELVCLKCSTWDIVPIVGGEILEVCHVCTPFKRSTIRLATGPDKQNIDFNFISQGCEL